MKIDTWILWAIASALFIIGEIVTPGFFLLWFGIGAGLAALVSFIGLEPVYQWGAFSFTTCILYILTRKFVERFSKRQPPGIGADRLIGRQGVVLEEIDNIKNTGRVRIDKEEWRAESVSGEVISSEKLVEVVEIQGTHLRVK